MAAYTRDESSSYRARRGRPAGLHSRGGRQPTSSAFITKDLEKRVATLSVDDTTSHASEVVRLRHVTPVASYSWLDAPVPTIVVPGSPLIWADERPPVERVPADAGVQYIHHDASKMGAHSPMLPLFAAIDALHDDFAYKTLDLVTDRNALRKLLRYIEDARGDDAFRIDVDVAGRTCLFTRREEHAAVAGQHVGYGHEYLRAATRAPRGCEGMVDHHRIITYRFGSLKILLGFTADACVEAEPAREEDALLASLSALSLGEGAQPRKPSPAGLQVRLGSPRTLVPQASLVEVKTRSSYREPNWREIYPQIYLSQTAWLYMAKHTAGVFQPVERIALAGEAMKPHAERMEEAFGKLKNLLKAIVKAAREQGEGVPLSVVRQGATLALWRRKEGSGKPLGEAIIARFK